MEKKIFGFRGGIARELPGIPPLWCVPIPFLFISVLIMRSCRQLLASFGIAPSLSLNRAPFEGPKDKRIRKVKATALVSVLVLVDKRAYGADDELQRV
ncbi:hypothetical protein SDJN02_03877 [Cucurbita argyrosperma subsp. argyrosperma]|nr:hypothetical protein SDJN02_03877 [Cucurbita argyrosperma subsp. argyrosperma]